MSTTQPHKPYPSDVTDDEWEFVVPYLTLMTPDALQRTYALRDVFNAVRWHAREHPGAICLVTSHPGRPSTSRRVVGWKRAALRR
jgi:transposase